MAAELVRILVAIEPRMYREVLTSHIRNQRPRSDVVLASPETLRDEVKRTRPHLIVADMVPSELKEMHYWVELRADEALSATISTDGYFAVIHDVSLEDLLAAVDKAEEDLAQGS
jgi:hypothetical protein